MRRSFAFATGRGVGLATAMVSLGCGRLPSAAPASAAPNESYVEVPFPPPASRVEIVPRRPDGDALWVDGQWTGFQRSQWTWENGGWVKPRAGVGFRPWSTRRQPDGVLEFAPPAWLEADGGTAPAPEFLARARRGDPMQPPSPDDTASTIGPAASGSAAPVAPPVNPAPLLDDASAPLPTLAPDASLPSVPADGGSRAAPNSHS